MLPPLTPTFKPRTLTMSPDTLNAAVIGCGRMGCSFDDSKSLRGFTYFPGSKELSPQDIPSALQYTAPNHHYFMKHAAHFIVEYLSTTFDKPDLSAYSGIEALKAINTLCQLKN